MFSAANPAHNPAPAFAAPRECKQAFNRRLMDKLKGFMSSEAIRMAITFARADGIQCRMPRECRRRALDAALQAIAYHYDLLGDRCAAALHTVAIQTGLATKSAAGNVSITRLTNALRWLSRIGLCEYSTEYNSDVGCYFPTDVSFTPRFWELLELDQAFDKARNSKAAHENKKRAKNGEQKFDLMGWLSARRREVRDFFHRTHAAKKAAGEARRRAEREQELTRAQIRERVRAEVDEDVRRGLIPAIWETVKAEIERRTSERTIRSRGNYSRV